MSVRIVIELKAAGGKTAALREAFEGVLDHTRAFVGCESAELLGCDETPGALTLLEQWRSLDDYHKYKAWRVASGTSVVSSPLVEGKPTVRVFDILDA